SEDYLYLATTTGIYECDKADPQITTAFSEYPGNNPQSIYLDTDNQIWSIASGKVYKANVLSGSQPGYVANSLDQDLYGRIWCGGYATEDGFEWENLSGIDDTDDEIVESLVSPEGLVYLRSTSGCLYVWGK
ncbi:MAG: hypothetical protein U9P80_03710, partial [Thermodesulfobacteriota bacterium]|nr:hypothetical protein [Thermodesulfobacteriota bacterium]